MKANTPYLAGYNRMIRELYGGAITFTIMTSDAEQDNDSLCTTHNEAFDADAGEDDEIRICDKFLTLSFCKEFSQVQNKSYVFQHNTEFWEFSEYK